MDTAKLPALTEFSTAALDTFFGDIRAMFDREAERVATQDDAEALRVRWVGRKQGLLQQVSDLVKQAPAEARKEIGQRFNTLKREIESRCEAPAAGRKNAEAASGRHHGRGAAPLDVTLPGIRPPLGAEHPLIRTMDEIVSIFQRMGYSVGIGPEVESDYYNFEALNFPPNHPARDTQDTLVVAGQEQRPARDRLLLRTHTSPVQIRTMESQPPPLRIVIPGKVHRNDAADATHSPVFHQVEGLCVDKDITFSDLKGTLDHAMKELFGSSVKTRFFPSFFPFTEPSADVQISCIFCGGRGCRKCKNSGWIELLGCGMVHPAVFEAVRGRQPEYDPEKISGFAFGMGVDRITMMLHGIGEIGLLYSGDCRFLESFT